MSKLSTVLAVFNEEENLADCLNSVKDISNEIVIVDGGSSDNTVKIAESFSAKVIQTSNPLIFHINKQKALDAAKYDWILQLDADERVSSYLATEIKKTIDLSNEELEKLQGNLSDRELFSRHQRLLETRDGSIGQNSKEYCAFFVPRLNFFLGKYLKYGGVYPDGVIRLVKKNKAFFPCKSVHEQITVKGKVGWLQHNLIHMADPTLNRYLKRNNRYINLLVQELEKNKVEKNFYQLLIFFLLKPIFWFLLTQIRYKGILDGYQGVIFSFFSALRFPRAYFRYLKK